MRAAQAGCMDCAARILSRAEAGKFGKMDLFFI